MKCAIVVGHEEKAKGASSVSPLSQMEYDFNLRIAQAIYRLLREEGKVSPRIFLRDGIGISGAYSQVNAWVSDDPKSCAIELHFNSFNGKAEGSETLYDKDPAQSKEFAQIIQDALVLCYGRQGKLNRGIKLIEAGDRGHKNLALCHIPSCIVEPFFGDCPAEAKLAHEREAEYPKYLAKAISKFLSGL